MINGDASKTIKKYLKSNQQTLISLAYFDIDIYKPTKDCLKAIKPYLIKGSVIGFDEPNSKKIFLEKLLLLKKYLEKLTNYTSQNLVLDQVIIYSNNINL